MDRRVPKSEKYAHIKGTLDTGPTLEKVKVVTAREFSKRRDEIFFRLKKAQLVQLYNEYEADEYESISHSPNGSEPRVVTYDQYEQPEYDKPYLILDARDVESFNTCHLLQARSFPYTLLRRDQLHPDVYRYRNKPETLIIVYCDDEKISRDMAKVLVDRGTDNIFLLTGGLNEFASDFPEFVEGQIPASLSGAQKASSNTSTYRSTSTY
jgi:centrosomal protein CEP41